MILKEKIEFVKNKLLKQKVGVNFFTFVLSMFLAIINIVAIIGETIEPGSFAIQKQIRTQRDNEIIITFLWVTLTILVMWCLNSVANIMINKLFKHNFFRALRWAKIKAFTIFCFDWIVALSKKVNQIDTKELNMIRNLSSSKNLVLQGSKAIAFKYKDFYREPNDIDFIALKSSLEQFDVKKLEIEIDYEDEWSLKGHKSNLSIEILKSKLIPQKYVTSVIRRDDEGFNVPNKHWMLAMKLHQLLTLYQLHKQGKNIEAKLNNNLIDLAFLLSKFNLWCSKKSLKYFMTLSVSNMFVSYALNSKLFDDFEEVNEFIAFLSQKVDKIGFIDELKSFFEISLQKILNEPLVVKLHKNINKIVENKEKIETLYIESSTADEKNIRGLKRLFSSEQELHNFENKHYLKEIQSLKNFNFINGFSFQNTQNSIDIREILMWELIKNMEVSYENQ